MSAEELADIAFRDESKSEAQAIRAAEMEVLAGCFAAKVTRDKVRAILQREDFDTPRHLDVWDTFHHLDLTGEAVSAASTVAWLGGHDWARELIPELARTVGQAEALTSARIVRAASRKRKAGLLLAKYSQRVAGPGFGGDKLIVDLANEATALRDAGVSAEDDTSMTLRALLEMEEEAYDWIVPGLLERGDRFMLTGEEGLGKSMLFRQIGVCIAAGRHPFEEQVIDPHNVVLFDIENNHQQIRRAMTHMTNTIVQERFGNRDPRDHFIIEKSKRVDITDDMVLSRIHALLDRYDPAVLIIGPLYRLTPRNIQTDDEATPVLAALDTIKDRGISLLIEAHAGNSREGAEGMRPRGSAALRGWPEFGYGMRWGDTPGTATLQAWRGDRDARDWPHEIERGGNLPWTLSEGEKLRRIQSVPRTPIQFYPPLRPVN
ncbi:MAG: AAA family ATPase [Aeromicrobium sp.]|uniref:AAA family ATPase n=1 Tax=Aeromicrobium sp. TaxID=1871063 RepID=UPI00262ED95D|nr:AAA family ATPase [Aeromicrobium sp.]MDF1705035.1 AAA family ATPase [Aeromicrobium sp.]